MSLPSLQTEGLPVSADGISRLIEETRARGLGSGKVALVGQRGGGTVLAKPSRGLYPAASIRGARAPAPFDITVTGTTATFRAGTINSLLPSNYLAGVTIVSTGTRYLVLNCTSSNGQITAASFSADVSPPSAIAPYAGQPPVAFSILIGVTINAAAVKVWANGNIGAYGAESFRLQKASPVAGQVPYDIYYSWNLSVL